MEHIDSILKLSGAPVTSLSGRAFHTKKHRIKSIIPVLRTTDRTRIPTQPRGLSSNPLHTFSNTSSRCFSRKLTTHFSDMANTTADCPASGFVMNDRWILRCDWRPSSRQLLARGRSWLSTASNPMPVTGWPKLCSRERLHCLTNEENKLQFFSHITHSYLSTI